MKILLLRYIHPIILKRYRVELPISLAVTGTNTKACATDTSPIKMGLIALVRERCYRSSTFIVLVA